MPISETDARQALQTLLKDFGRLTPDERRQMSEASVVRQFIDRLLEEVLGWPIKDPARYKYELTTQVGRPDLTLIPERGGTIFIEAIWRDTGAGAGSLHHCWYDHAGTDGAAGNGGRPHA